jgi:hypothetical protein
VTHAHVPIMATNSCEMARGFVGLYGLFSLAIGISSNHCATHHSYTLPLVHSILQSAGLLFISLYPAHMPKDTMQET